ncbi:unnamed protein product [Moneuplotes crassus]|uniref:Uncharacterized protein n=1 Tax=Euplotes crassus TaxID=5936 RepID=A0AAD1TZH6_EUPCR|nr:unnamed protein product [Moneuplotes crassus]
MSEREDLSDSENSQLEEDLEEILKLKEKIMKIKRKRSRSVNRTVNKSRDGRKHKQKESNVRSRSGSNDTIATYNPILGYSESEPKRKRLKEEYSEYVREKIRQDEKSKSRTRKHVRIDDSHHDTASLHNFKNDYAHKQRYKHSYFKYRDDNSSTSPARHQEDTFSYIKVEDATGRDKYRDDSLNKRESSPAGTIVSILPHEHESPIQKENKKRALAAELQAQIQLKNERKQKEKESKKNMDYKYLYEYMQSDPFGKMGAGAPLRDAQGHIVANRLKTMDEATSKSFHQSFYNQNSEGKHQKAEEINEKNKMQNLNEEEIGLQFLSWNNQEKHRKEMLQEEWKHELDEQAERLKTRKDEEKRKKLVYDLKLEEKIKKDLRELSEEFERETGTKSNKHNNFSVGKENSVNYLVTKRRKHNKGSEYHKSRMSSKDGSIDRMEDFNGLEEEDDNDVRSRIDQGYTNDVNIKNLREDLRRREGAVNAKIHTMKQSNILQQAEIRSTFDSLLQLQQDMEEKNKDRRTSNGDFYSTLAHESKALLNSLRAGKRNSLPPNYSYSQTMPPGLENPYKTPYEQRFGVDRNREEAPSFHHESVFINTDAPQPSQGSPNEVLDDLINSYGGPNTSQFSLPLPKSSMRHQADMPPMEQPYNDEVFNTEESQAIEGNPEDSLNQLVNEVEESNNNLQEVT